MKLFWAKIRDGIRNISGLIAREKDLCERFGQKTLQVRISSSEEITLGIWPDANQAKS